MSNQLSCVVSIAGTDPSGGAGIQADIKAISATGAYAATVITALLAQNTQGVQAIENVSADFVRLQMDSVFNDLEIHAVKIGMLQDARIIMVVSECLKQRKPRHVVFDPVMVAKDGSVLLALETIALLKQRLIPETHLLTPNLFEAEHLYGAPVKTPADMETAAISIGSEHGVNVLIKGGHLNGKESADVLYDKDKKQCRWFYAERFDTKNTHGTGCSLSAAIASYLGQGYLLTEAIEAAKYYLTQAIRSGMRYNIGMGNGPVDHFYFMDNR